MNPADPAPGSDLYYASLYVSTDLRTRLALIEAIKSEICTVPITVSDVGIARVKLQWWRTEIEQLSVACPRHELTNTYYRDYGVDHELADAFDALITGLDANLGGHNLFADRLAQHRWFDNTFGPIYRHQSALAGTVDPDLLEICGHFGRSIEIAYSLLGLQPLLRRSLKRLPEDSLLAAGCSWEDLANAADNPRASNVIDSETTAVSQHLLALSKQLSRKSRRELRFVYTLARIVSRTLTEMQNDGCRFWLHRVELTPLHKLGIAWRARL